MLTRLYLSGLTLLYLCSASQTNNPAPFCAQTNSLGPNMAAPITNVKLGTATATVLNNTSGWGTNGWDYTYYSNLPTHTIVLGVPQVLSVTFGACNLFNNMYFSVYIDLNSDNQFAAAERIFDNTLAGNIPIPVATAATFTHAFTVAGATGGTTRMRVIRGGNPTQTTAAFVPGFVVLPCPNYTNSFLYGEVEDYAVEIAGAPATATFNLFLGTICAGTTVMPLDQSFNNPTSYSWTATGAVPATSTLQAPQFVYPVPGTYSLSLTVSNATSVSIPAIKTITVNPTPTVAVISSVGGSTANALLCKGKSATLTATGASSYSWNTGAVSSVVVVSPTATIGYSVTGKNAFGCSAQAVATVSVQNCTSVNNLNRNDNGITVYPNPGSGVYRVDLKNGNGRAATLEVYNSVGELVVVQHCEGAALVDLRSDKYTNGVYYIRLREQDGPMHKVILLKIE